MSFGGGGACYRGEVAIAMTLGGRWSGRDDPRSAGCLVLL